MKWEIPTLAAATLAVVLFADASRIKPQNVGPVAAPRSRRCLRIA